MVFLLLSPAHAATYSLGPSAWGQTSLADPMNYKTHLDNIMNSGIVALC